MPEFKVSNGKYYPRSQVFNMAQSYWISQFWQVVQMNRKTA